MSLTDLQAKRRRLLDEREQLADRLTNDTTRGEGLIERLERLDKGLDKVDAEITEARDDERQRVAVGAAGGLRIERGSDDSHNYDDDGASTVRTADEDRAHRTINAAFRDGLLPAHAAANATALVDTGLPGERGLAARWAIAAGSPEYRTAFAKLLADPTHGHLLWTGPESEAYRAVAAVQAEMETRTAMSTTVGNGGYMIPLTLDPAILLTNDGSTNPLRALATIKQTTTNAWAGVTSAGATAEWKAEAAEVADGSPTVAQPSIPVFFGDAFVPYSFEIGMDAVNFLDELTTVLVDAADQLMATAYTTGSGSGQPQGIVTGLAGTLSEINTTGTEAIVAADPYTLQNALPARFSANATWQSHIAIANAYRQFETTGGALMFPELREDPPRLIGKRWYENSNMDGAINAAATANNYVLIYGDVAKGFYIVDRVGSTLELIPNLFHTGNNRPSGQRGALLWFRTGSEVVVPQALRLLDVPTTA